MSLRMRLGIGGLLASDFGDVAVFVDGLPVLGNF